MRNLITLLLIVTLVGACENSRKIEHSYTILKEEKNEGIKKVNIEIRLKKEVNEAELKEIALNIKEERENFKMLWIFYYLPGHKVGSGAWATTHFTPDLEVKVLGVTKEASEEANKVKVTGEIINTWFDNDAVMPSKTYLVKENGKLYMKSLYPKNGFTDASKIIEELVETKEGDVTRYDYDNSHEEYYVVEKNGNLGMYGRDGKFKEAVKEK